MFNVTYEIVLGAFWSHYGDAAERGFVLADGSYLELSGADKPNGSYAMSLRDAVALMGCCEDSGNWFTETDGRHDYRTGAETQFSLHPPKTITAASYSRLARLLGAR